MKHATLLVLTLVSLNSHAAKSGVNMDALVEYCEARGVDTDDLTQCVSETRQDLDDMDTQGKTLELIFEATGLDAEDVGYPDWDIAD